MPKTETGSAFVVAFGVRVRNKREQRGMLQTELGEELGVSFQQVQKYENGSNTMNVERLNDLAIALGTTPHWLMGWPNERRKNSK